ncbi:MAG TPA: hypothetical protein VF962_09960 [Gemmatimonadaceae bacterium]
MVKIIIAAILGVILGATGPYYAFLGWYSVIPWGLVALAVGSWCSKRQSLYAGALYGFCLNFSFMIAGYTGTASLLSRLPFFILIGLFGAVCGIALSVTGYFLKVSFTTLGPED